MSHWLLKTEPGEFSWDDLARKKKSAWDGVHNPTALKHIRTMKKGDLALMYHTGDERAMIGIAEVISSPYRDPSQHDERIVVVDVRAVRKLPNAVTLDQIKADKTFAGWDLLRIGRLSVVPVPEKMWKRIEQLAGGSAQGSRSKERDQRGK